MAPREPEEDFIVERRGKRFYINGQPLLEPFGEPSVPRERLRQAVQKVARELMQTEASEEESQDHQC